MYLVSHRLASLGKLQQTGSYLGIIMIKLSPKRCRDWKVACLLKVDWRFDVH
jgi:hypothetical protein